MYGLISVDAGVSMKMTLRLSVIRLVSGLYVRHAIAAESSFPRLVLEFRCVPCNMHKGSGAYRSEVVQFGVFIEEYRRVLR